MERQELITSGFSLDAISRFRTLLMGLAALNVMLLHIFQNFELVCTEAMLRVFESGADVFILLSGFGLFYSLDKGFSLGSYIKKRLLRIYPEYALSCVLFGILFGIGVSGIVQDLLTVSFWINASLRYWFISLIIVMYIVYPFLHQLIKKSDAFAIVLIAVFIAVDIILPFIIKDYYWERSVAFDRIPSFFAGAFIAKKAKYGKISFEKARVLYFVIIALASLLLSLTVGGAHYRLVLLPWTISYTVVVAFIAEHTKPGNIVVKMMTFMGMLSLQIYLFNGHLMEYLRTKLVTLSLNKAAMILLSVILTLVTAYIVKLLCDKFRQIIGTSDKNNNNRKFSLQ